VTPGFGALHGISVQDRLIEVDKALTIRRQHWIVGIVAVSAAVKDIDDLDTTT
jgi:hypothetical protein